MTIPSIPRHTAVPGTTSAASPSAGRPAEPLAVTVVARKFAGVVAAAFTMRLIGLTVVVTVLLGQDTTTSVVFCLPAVAACLLGPEGGPARPDHEPWGVLGWADVISALLVFGAAAWATADLSATWRYLAIGAASMLVAAVSTRLCLDPRWYRAGRSPSRGIRALRLAAGPLGMLACQLIALTAPWDAGERTVIGFLTLLPLANVPLTVDQDQTVSCVVEMIRTEAQDGRQAVLDELHGTLSANLRLLEQASQDLRSTSPRLYELAVGANSRLRETLALADPHVDSAARPQTLGALVRTLTMAVGARGDLTVRVDQLADADRDLVRLALNDLLRVCLARGAAHVQVELGLHRGTLELVVLSEDVAAEPADATRLAPLRERLAAVDGRLSDRRTRSGGPAGRFGDPARGQVRRRLTASWPAAPGTS